jgi:hypothetical protein
MKLSIPEKGSKCKVSVEEANFDNVTKIAKNRHRQGLEISERIERLAKPKSMAQAVAFRMRECSSNKNIFVADDLMNSSGELFTGNGNLTQCKCRLCPPCQAEFARATRKTARAAVNQLDSIFDNYTKAKLGLRQRGVLLTMPLMKKANVDTAMKRIQKAFGLLIEREFWKSRVYGGIKGIEFTVRVTGDETNGYHIHIHLLLLSRFIPVDADTEEKFERLRQMDNLTHGNLHDTWKECLIAAGATVDTKRLVVEVCDAVNRAERRAAEKTGRKLKRNSVSIEKAILETAKYLTKYESWKDVQDSDLVEMAEIERWGRMFEVLGFGRAGRHEKLFLALIFYHAPQMLTSVLFEDFVYTNFVQMIAKSDSLPEFIDNLREINDTANAIASSFNTPTLKSGESTQPEQISTLERAETWREKFKRMSWDSWKQWQEDNFKRIRRFRRRQLAFKFPQAIFVTLAEEVWTYKMVNEEIEMEEMRKYHLPPLTQNHYRTQAMVC